MDGGGPFGWSRDANFGSHSLTLVFFGGTPFLVARDRQGGGEEWGDLGSILEMKDNQEEKPSRGGVLPSNWQNSQPGGGSDGFSVTSILIQNVNFGGGGLGGSERNGVWQPGRSVSSLVGRENQLIPLGNIRGRSMIGEID